MDAWIAIGAIGAVLTAAFTGGYLVITWRSHRHAVISGGRARPVRIRAVDALFLQEWPQVLADFSGGAADTRTRMGMVRGMNRSDIDQRITINARKSRVVWPPRAR